MKKDITLVIMAAGIGSRYGGGIKQLESVGPCGEIIMDYSVYDALEVGFNKIVFVIRKDLEEDFREVIGNRMENICRVEYAFQEKDDLPEGFTVPEGRTKPWGTGQAILACRGIVNEPFAVINADDYYGKSAFRQVYDYLATGLAAGDHGESTADYCMAGFILKNTLSDNGTVTRGICQVDDNGYLTKVDETRNIRKTPQGAVAADADGTVRTLDGESHVSMNMWGLTPEFLDVLSEGFPEFLKEHGDDLKAEYLLPEIIDRRIRSGQARVKVLETPDPWFGITYKEDKAAVVDAIAALIKEGKYPERLFGTMKTKVYFVRHAEPNYENHDDLTRELTEQGMKDRLLVTEFLKDKNIGAVWSSPYHRAIDTVKHFADGAGLEIETDYDFRERKVGDGWLDDFDSFAEKQWGDFAFALEHGESLGEVQKRNLAALERVLNTAPGKNIAIGSHGTALSTVVNHFDPAFGYEDFQRIVDLMPWVVELTFEDGHCVEVREYDLFQNTCLERLKGEH
ncbi:MAG: histidine phosphatase family protein [Firmicutes bacterium]|nr:histidine phosphatase family protein [Bacillota bacterium]